MAKVNGHTCRKIFSVNFISRIITCISDSCFIVAGVGVA